MRVQLRWTPHLNRPVGTLFSLLGLVVPSTEQSCPMAFIGL